jgi:hypothetical protein
MARKYAWGLSKIEIGNIAGDGGIATTWTQIGDTEQGSATFTEEEGTIQEFFVEESDDPVFTGRTQPGSKTFTFSTNDLSTAQLAVLKGGTASGNGTSTPLTWEAPEVEAEVEKSVRMTLRTGQIIEIVRAKLVANLDWNLGKEQLGKVTVTCTILKPTKANTKSFKFIDPVPA